MTDRYVCSSTQEHFSADCTAETEAKAIEAWAHDVDAKPGDIGYLGEVAFDSISSFVPCGEDLIEALQDRARESEAGEFAESWLDDVTPAQAQELEDAVDAAVVAWAEKHGQQPQFFTVDNIKQIVYKADDE